MNFLLITAVVILILAAFAFLWLKPGKGQKPRGDYTEALSAIVRGDDERAVELLRAVVRHDSNHIEAYMHLGDILRNQNQAKKALKIHQSLTVRPDLPRKYRLEIHRSLVMDYQRLMDYDRASREAEQVLKIDRKNLWANEVLLEIAQHNQDWDKALQLVKTVQRLKGRVDVDAMADIKLKEGRGHLDKNNFKEAISCYQKAHKTAPSLGDPLYELGELYYKQGNLENAVKYWERFALCTPESSKKVFNRVEATLFELGRFSEAENFYRHILTADSSNLDAMVRLANVLVEKGEQRAAINLVEETLNKSAESIPANLMKLKLSLGTKNPHELSRQIDKLMEMLASDIK